MRAELRPSQRSNFWSNKIEDFRMISEGENIIKDVFPRENKISDIKNYLLT
jgi:hypothetical protein